MIDNIKQAVSGLNYLSEAAFPFEVHCYDDKNISIEEYLRLISQRSKDAQFTILTLEEFFENQIQMESFSKEKNFERMQQFSHLKEVIKSTLEDVKVYLIGLIHVNAYIVGNCTGEYIIISTEIVEI